MFLCWLGKVMDSLALSQNVTQDCLFLYFDIPPVFSILISSMFIFVIKSPRFIHLLGKLLENLVSTMVTWVALLLVWCPPHKIKKSWILKSPFYPTWNLKPNNFSFSCMENLLILLSSQNASLQLYIVRVILILSWCKHSGKKSLRKVGLNEQGVVRTRTVGKWYN